VPRDWFSLGFRSDGTKLSFGREQAVELGKLRSKVVLFDADSAKMTPLRKSAWLTENQLLAPMAGPVYLIGQVGANSESQEWQQYKLVGRTGVGWKLPAWLGGDVQIRGGKALTNFDAERQSMIPDQSRTFLELVTKWALPGSLQLEFLSESVMNPAGNDLQKRDLRLAVPITQSGQVHFGAKYWSMPSSDPAAWRDRMRFYMGVQWQR